MTSRERVFAAFDHKEVDRTPIFEYVLLSPVADEILGHRYVDYGGDRDKWREYADEQGGYDKAIRLYASDRAELALRLKHDLIYCVPNPPPAVSGAEPPNDYDEPVEIIRRNSERTRKSLEKPLHDFSVYRYIREELEKRDMDIPIYAPAFTHGIWTNTALMETMLLDPDAAQEHFELATLSALKIISQYNTLNLDIIGIGGDFSGNRSLISPEMYRDYIMPEIKKLSGFIRESGHYSVNVSDGKLWNVLEYFLYGAGVDGYGEIDSGAGMDLGILKANYGEKITFLGNIDCGNLLSFGKTEEIKKTVFKCLKDGMGSGGHIFTASNAISASISIKNYLTMINSYREYFGLPDYKL